MKRLFVLRHARAAAGPDDHSRPLGARGNRDSLWLGRYLEENHLLPDLALCSSAVRAKETLARVQAGANICIPTRFRDDFYLAAAHYIMTQIQNLESAITAPIIIGHNPGLSQLFQKLTRDPPRDSRSLKYPTCTLAILQFDITDWSQLQSNTARLIDMIIVADRSKGPT